MSAISMIKGVLLRGILRDVKEVYPDGIPKFVESLPPEIRERDFAVPIAPSTWYPYETLVAMLKTYLKVVGGGRLQSLQDLGERAAKRDLGTILKIYMMFSSPHKIGDHGSTVWYQRYKDCGHMLTTDKEERSFRLTVKNFEDIHPLNCTYLTGYGWGVIRAWNKSAVVSHDRCVHNGDRDCSWLSKW